MVLILTVTCFLSALLSTPIFSFLFFCGHAYLSCLCRQLKLNSRFATVVWSSAQTNCQRLYTACQEDIYIVIFKLCRAGVDLINSDIPELRACRVIFTYLADYVLQMCVGRCRSVILQGLVSWCLAMLEAARSPWEGQAGEQLGTKAAPSDRRAACHATSAVLLL